MKDGSYAEPYQMKPFGSLEVINRKIDRFRECNLATYPKAEKIQLTLRLASNDCARMLVDSLHIGKLINRVPFT